MSLRSPYDDRMVDIGSLLFDAHMQLSGFVLDILQEFDECRQSLGFGIPIQIDGEYSLVFAAEIFIEAAMVFIKPQNGEIIHWDELHITAQECIANFLHLQYTSKNYYNSLS